jgi:hypothetical protein
MPRRVLVRSPTSAFNLLEVPAANEHDLQEVVIEQVQGNS